MCLAIPGKIIKINHRQAEIQYPDNQTRTAMVGLPDLQVGDCVMVQMGVIIKKFNPKEALKVTQAWQG